MGSRCDYPSLIGMGCINKNKNPNYSFLGNDEFYGGLGGEFTISTSSETSGTIVLRHEMGHNFANVGEEYDGGQVYRGANSDDLPLDPNGFVLSDNFFVSCLIAIFSSIKWGAWLSEPGDLKVEDSRVNFQDYPWSLVKFSKDLLIDYF